MQSYLAIASALSWLKAGLFSLARPIFIAGGSLSPKLQTKMLIELSIFIYKMKGALGL